MQPDILAKVSIRRIAAKEITLFFASPIAYLFLATFAAITLFVFFWGESFFARNIADVRPLFEWMPVLLIFLSATLTMRLWSEERRSGTLEYVLTQAVPLWHFVVGKFLGCLFLLAVALLITLPLPITVSIIGELDWGPVIAGYLATLFMGATYLSIGLFVSSRSNNQIVSLISAAVLCGIFYLIGTSVITNFFGNNAGEWLRQLGTGSRFESITRGVIDLRDIYYYVSLVLVFLALNTLMLEKECWASGSKRPRHKRWILVTSLIIANALSVNFWLGQVNILRIDVTSGNQYSISESTKGYLKQLQEPLLIRGYFSGKTHPLLSPLVPQMRDLIKEYQVAGQGDVRVEFIDPLSSPELEEEANQKFAIRPVPFQVADRYQSSIVSSYFNILVQYGDEHQVLGFEDLIEVQARNQDIDVRLRNPEHDLTRAIKKVLNNYQSGGNLFDTVKTELSLTAYVSDDSQLPDQLIDFKHSIQKVSEDFVTQSSGQLKSFFIDPSDNNSVANQIAEDYGFRPMASSLFSHDQFYFYLTLQGNDQVVQLPLDDLSEDAFKRNLEAGIKRFASGFTKTVVLVKPQPKEPTSPYMPNQVAQFSQLEKFLGEELNVQSQDLNNGEVSGEADILVLVSPQELNNKQLFAVDQFLMKGGTIIAATSPYSASLSNRGLQLNKQSSGLEDWFQHHGITIEESLVMDPKNAAFPVPVTRNVGGFQLQEMQMLDYPYFTDIREEGVNSDHLITSELPQVTMTWASPILVDEEQNKSRKITSLLHSSSGSWLSDSLDIMPKVTPQGESAFASQGAQSSHLLGVINQGRFNSYFTGKPSPLLASKEGAQDNAEDINQLLTESEVTANQSDSKTNEGELQITSVIEHSPESSRIILFSSNDFLRDQVLQMVGSAQQSEYMNTIQMAANAIDWSLEDSGLLSIRSRGHFNRTLPPMEQSSQMFWEYLNYILAALAIIIVALLERKKRLSKNKRYLELFAS